MNDYTFNTFNSYTAQRIADALLYLNKHKSEPIFICIGSDLVLGDCLGPIIGTNIKNNNLERFVYGTLKCPITAKDINIINKHVETTHRNGFLIAIDSAIGSSADVGLVKIRNGGIVPGLGVNKKLPTVGRIGIMGIVAERSENNKIFYNNTRLNLIYSMANTISEGINLYCKYFKIKSA